MAHPTEVILAVDPGVRHIAWTVSEWKGKELIGVREARVFSTHSKKKTRDAAWEMAQAIYPGMIESKGLTYVVVEGQHCQNRRGRPEDIRDLAFVAGACVQAFSPLASCFRMAPTDRPGLWSSTKKEQRHERLLNHYGLDNLQGIVNDWKGDYSKREVGDLLDTIGMDYWLVSGCPVVGI